MRRCHPVVVGLSTLFLLISLPSFAQLDVAFAPFDCRDHAEWFQEVPAVEAPAPDTLRVPQLAFEFDIDTVNAWREWSLVQNFSFGKDRGSMSMINDLDALHPYFRDKVSQLIVECRKKGIQLAVVETYRTHAKQNEYKIMGRKYTNSTGGKSKHQYGLAVDVVPVVDSVAIWDNVALWKKVGAIGEKLGLRWGGRWKKPYDPGHFEWTGGLTSAHLSHGIYPTIPADQYPCIEEDLKALRKFWKEWEAAQSSTTSTSNNTIVNSPTTRN
jgi:peptidoglycan L-alanyl-D-glutamate endopeptidase CwlK